MRGPGPDRLVIADSPERFGKHVERLGREREDCLAVDTETTGLDWLRDRVGGISFAAGRTSIFAYGDALSAAALYLSDQVKRRRRLVFHHAKFDLHMLYRTFGLHVPYPVDDTMILSFLYDNRGTPLVGGHHLKDLAGAFVDPTAREPQSDLLDSIRAGGGVGMEDWLLGDPELAGRYGALDAWYTLCLRDFFRPKVRAIGQARHAVQSMWQLYQNERWLILALRDMEERGILMDRAYLEGWRTRLLKSRDIYEAKINEIARWPDFNWRSTSHLRKLLFEELKLTPSRFTKNGAPSTDEVALLGLTHPTAQLILNLRDVEKQHGTYAESLINWIRDDGRIHCSFKQHGARTGRLSALEPNLQNQPRESGARRGFIPDPGLQFYFADNSQAEMRFAAHESNEPMLVKGFIRDPDFDTHAATARVMYGVREPTKQQRKMAKIVNFLTIFGGGLNKLRESLMPMMTPDEAKFAVRELGHSVSKGSDPHLRLAQLILKRYHSTLPRIKPTANAISDEIRNTGFTTNVFGRRRYLPEEECYKGFNTRVQGNAADLAKQQIVGLYRELQLSGDIALLLQIHDEAVYLAEPDPRIHRRTLEIMEDRTRFRVPILASLEFSTTNWQEKQKWTDSSLRRSKAKSREKLSTTTVKTATQ